MIIGLSLPKRILMYLSSGVFFGLAFTYMFNSFASFSDGKYIFGFVQDSALTGALFCVLFGFALEVFRKIVISKFKKVKLELSKTSTILLDNAANLIAAGKPFEGWLFLTTEKLIFRPLGRKKPEITVTLSQIKNTNKFGRNGLEFFAENTSYKIMVADRDKWFDSLQNISAPTVQN